MNKFIKINNSPQAHQEYIIKPKFVMSKADEGITHSQTQKNLFAGSAELIRKLPEHEKGPRIDRQGNLIKHTIVGSVQNFMKENERRQHKTQIQIAKNKAQFKRSLHPNDAQPDGLASNRSISHSFQKLTEYASTTTIGKSKKKNREFQEIILNEDEVVEEIKAVQERLNKNKELNEYKNQNLKKSLNKGDSLQIDNYTRAMDNFNQTQMKWENNKKVTSIVVKSPGSTMHDRIEQYRVREEMRQLLDNLTPPEVRYGNKFWQLGLRQSESALKKPYPYKYVDQEELNQKITDPKPPAIEVVRKPNSVQASYRPFTSFSTRKYLDKKLSENQDLIAKLIPTQPEQLEHLELQGKNVFQSEANVIKQAKQSQQAFLRVNSVDYQKFIKKMPLKQEQTEPDATITQNYDKKRMLIRGKFGSTMGFF